MHSARVYQADIGYFLTLLGRMTYCVFIGVCRFCQISSQFRWPCDRRGTARASRVCSCVMSSRVPQVSKAKQEMPRHKSQPEHTGPFWSRQQKADIAMQRQTPMRCDHLIWAAPYFGLNSSQLEMRVGISRYVKYVRQWNLPADVWHCPLLSMPSATGRTHVRPSFRPSTQSSCRDKKQN